MGSFSRACAYHHTSVSQQRGPFFERKRASIYKKSKNSQLTNSFCYRPFAMAPPNFIRSASSIGSPSKLETLSMSSPGICQCENQLAHWDWAGREHENLPEQCRRRPAIEE